MKLYGGIDLHSNNCAINLIDENGLTVLQKRVKNCLQTILSLFNPFKDCIQGLVVESTYNWYWQFQETRCREYAKNRNYEVVGTYHEGGVSGKLLDRPAMQQMLRFIKAPKR